MDSIAALVFVYLLYATQHGNAKKMSIVLYHARAVIIKWATMWAQAHAHFTCPTISWWARVVVV